ncbi:hypothetical protein EDD15DRAFT_2374166 [Pisolithus albus]|nr:hypothetical protein EDD15DRAFT_2374166 [Pisolithus albus]
MFIHGYYTLDRKVYIHSVDAQSSANGEQRNGYFVLNDIFRFLKGTTAEDDVSETDAATLVDQPSSSPEQPAAEPQFYTLLPPTANAASTMVRVNISFSCRIVG